MDAFSTDGVQQGLTFLLDALGFTGQDNSAPIDLVLKAREKLPGNPEIAKDPLLMEQVSEIAALATGVLRGARHLPPPSL
jgi:hypothetical protein